MRPVKKASSLEMFLTRAGTSPAQSSAGFQPVQAEDEFVAVACGLDHDGLKQSVSLDRLGHLFNGGFVEVPETEAARFNPVYRDLGDPLRHQVPPLG